MWFVRSLGTQPLRFHHERACYEFKMADVLSAGGLLTQIRPGLSLGPSTIMTLL
ncbi:hypothetical protein Hdeb2414_s0001g00026061 [Helianthus debilis subsp. tardiflorus]